MENSELVIIFLSVLGIYVMPKELKDEDLLHIRKLLGFLAIINALAFVAKVASA